MSDRRSAYARLPLLVLVDAVCFPGAELRIPVAATGLESWIDGLEPDATPPRLAVVLQKPRLETPGVDGPGGAPDVFPAGTAGRVVRIEPGEDGGAVVVRGEFRFALEERLGTGLGEAIVRPVFEPDLSELDPAVLEVRDELVALVGRLALELGDRFEMSVDEVHALADDSLSYEIVVNRLAAGLDLSPLRQLRLLAESLPDRALHLLSLLRTRERVLDVLRPYRGVARCHELN